MGKLDQIAKVSGAKVQQSANDKRAQQEQNERAHATNTRSEAPAFQPGAKSVEAQFARQLEQTNIELSHYKQPVADARPNAHSSANSGVVLDDSVVDDIFDSLMGEDFETKEQILKKSQDDSRAMSRLGENSTPGDVGKLAEADEVDPQDRSRADLQQGEKSTAQTQTFGHAQYVAANKTEGAKAKAARESEKVKGASEKSEGSSRGGQSDLSPEMVVSGTGGHSGGGGQQKGGQGKQGFSDSSSDTKSGKSEKVDGGKSSNELRNDQVVSGAGGKSRDGEGGGGGQQRDGQGQQGGHQQNKSGYFEQVFDGGSALQGLTTSDLSQIIEDAKENSDKTNLKDLITVQADSSAVGQLDTKSKGDMQLKAMLAMTGKDRAEVFMPKLDDYITKVAERTIDKLYAADRGSRNGEMYMITVKDSLFPDTHIKSTMQNGIIQLTVMAPPSILLEMVKKQQDLKDKMFKYLGHSDFEISFKETSSEAQDGETKRDQDNRDTGYKI